MNSRTLTGLALTAGLTATLLGGAVRPATAVQVELDQPTAGAAGIGDPYFVRDGNGGIDVLHYDVHDRYAFGPQRIVGRTKLDVRATQDLSRFNLDFLLDVSSVTVDGTPATFSSAGDHELRIKPSKPLAAGEEFRVVVEYAGTPAAESSQGESNWLADDTEVVAMNEPHMATWWFPANDHPRDKASFDIRITTAKGKQVVANGVLVDRKRAGQQVTTHWRAVEPMAPYLAFFAAGSFEIRQGNLAGRPWYVAVSKQIDQPSRADGMTLMLRSAEVTAWLESVLGPYPFSTTGGLMTGLPVSFALENQTRPTYPAVSSSSISLLVHELAHQWFGDSVSVDTWRDIWLNEGFASFMESYYVEANGGKTTQAQLEENYADRLPFAEFWKLRIDDPGRNHIFDSPVYDRGSMALAALRHRIGDPAFWTVLRTWVDSRRYGNGTIAQFEALAESTSGQDLDGFFTAWLDTKAPPARTADNGF